MSRYKVARRNAELLKNGCVVIDFETTGLNGPDVEIVEVAILNYDGEILLDTLLKPVRSIPLEVSRIHGITDEDVVDAPRFLDVYPKLMRHLIGQPVVAYNYSFEQSILNTVTGRYGLNIRVNPWVCAMRDYKAFRGFRNFAKLSTACKNEGITVENAHRALADCKMTLALMHKMAQSAR